MKLTKSIEDYLKAIYYLTVDVSDQETGTNNLAEYLSVSPASVSSMLKKLKDLKLVDYQKYGKLSLTVKGEELSLSLIRNHRLWETFLFEHLNFSWDEVHEVAHQLEHIKSPKLIKELDRFLGYPKIDPHGDVIPDQKGNMEPQFKVLLSEIPEKSTCKLISVKDNSAAFLKYVTQLELKLGIEIFVEEIREFDGSRLIGYEGKKENVSRLFSENVYVKLLK